MAVKSATRKALTALLLAALAGCGGGGSDTDWLYPFWVETGVSAGDIDGDGRTDIVTIARLSSSAGRDEGRLTVYRQLAPGSFAADPYTVGRYPWRVELRDLDGDDRPDLVVLDIGIGSEADVLHLMLQDRVNPGRFLAPRTIAAGLASYDFAIDDLNADGAPDIVIAGGPAAGDGALLLMQDPAQRGSFRSPEPLALPGRASRVATGDLDGDALVDLAFYVTTGFSTSTGSSGRFVTVAARAGGGFEPPVAFAPQIGLNAQLLRVADAQGDGLPDLLAAFTPFSTAYSARLAVLLQTGPGAFTAVDTSLAGLQGIDGFTIADLDGNGRPDLATTGFFPVGSPSQVRSNTNVVLHAGGGSYRAPTVYPMPAAMNQVAAADVDGDGRVDLVLLGGENRVFVMRQSRDTPGSFLAPLGL